MSAEIPRISSIFISKSEGMPMERRFRVYAMEGRGLEGDRYTDGRGYWQNVPNVREGAIRQITLISLKDIQAANTESGTAFEPQDTRRQLVVGGDIVLRDLVGKRFKVGEVEMVGIEECTPCKRPSDISGKEGFAQAFKDKGGLRAQILNSGYISQNSELIILE